MKKKAYRAVEVKNFNSDQLVSEFGNEKIVFGIDVAKTDFFAA